MITINANNELPIFEQIVLEIGKYIALGVYKPHEKLPPIRTLAKDLGVNPNTVAKAYQVCETSGLIYSLAGKGSYVSDKDHGVNTLVELAYEELEVIIKKLKDLGITKEEILTYIQEAI